MALAKHRLNPRQTVPVRRETRLRIFTGFPDDESPADAGPKTLPFPREVARTDSIGALRLLARTLARDLDAMRQRPAVRLLDRFFERHDLQNSLSPAYRRLKDDSLLFVPNLRAFRLQASVNLQRVGGLEYPLPLPRCGLNGLLLAPLSDLPPARGSLRMEIHWPRGEIAVRATFPAAELRRGVPLRLEFAPLPACNRPCRLGVFADNVDVPLYVLEWRRYRYWGLGRIQSRAFCGLLFADEARRHDRT